MSIESPDGTASASGSDQTRRPTHWLTVGFVLSSAFYTPVVLWASNPWYLSSPRKILLLGLLAFAIGLATFALVVLVGLDSRAAAFALGTAILLVMNWAHVDQVPWWIWVASLVAVALLGHLARRSSILDGALAVGIVVFGVAPLAQLGMAHIQESEPYPTIPLSVAPEASASGMVEDVAIIVVDSYPSLKVAEGWFEHDTTPLRRTLIGANYELRDIAWSHHTFTSLSVPAMLELQSVVSPGPTNSWDNLSSLYRIIRGENLVANSLSNAGFVYTHIESGWDASACGPQVDRCIRSPWIDEIVWHLIKVTPARSWFVDPRFNYRVPGTTNSVANLVEVAQQMSANATRDYVFAHLILPHTPVTVDGQCQPIPQSEDPEWLGFSAQLSCVDSLLGDLAGSFGESTAVLITADHGTGFGGQVQAESAAWSDEQIAERMTVLLAYRLPTPCDPPAIDTNVSVARAIMSCALDMTLPEWRPRYMIGLNGDTYISSTRVADIEKRIVDGSLFESDPGFDG